MTVQHKLGAQKEPIAIIGSGCRFPGNATSPSALWELLCNPTDLTKEIPDSRFSTKGVYHPDGEHHGASNVTKAYLLEQDPRLFDSVFFNIAPREAEAIDPQQRLVLETVYEAMEDSGLTLGNMRGSPTGCYVGVMTGDYAEVVTRDPETFSKYMATGTSRALISNRVSYVFDWNGPSLTVDTACSSSLVAVHMAVKALRDGEVDVACAAGSNLILNADTFIGETNLHMISVDGQSKMWDQSANGYARGEGVAAIFLKTLSQALKDGDRIDAIIRETGVNQDGRTQGITLPNPEAQAALIRSTYRRAGLDIDNPDDRCQYFEAHGTGTQAGDPREASAIKQAFFPDTDVESDVYRKLYVGSIKTVIGHTEGCAGVAGLLKAALALKNKTIPPNQHFNNLNPSVSPSYANLCVPTTPTTWPSLNENVLRRASVNSFGFGGTNAHAILEAYVPEIHDLGPWGLQQKKSPPATEITTIVGNDFTPLPFTLSANSNTALVALVEKYIEYLGSDKGRATSLHQVAATLQSHRSNLPFQVIFAGPSREQLLKEMNVALEKAKDTKTEIGKRSGQPPALDDVKILGVFTGQGAQWPTMGASLLHNSQHFRDTIAKLDASLQELPDAPDWTLAEELAAPASSSRVREAAISQPACTALQVALVDLLKAANVSFHTVIGHSSGEIGAAYAAGYISGTDAVRIAYYRGVHAKFAGGKDGQKGSMIAVGWGIEQAQEFCSSELRLNGRLGVAASNSPGSVTLSGDEEAVLIAKEMLDTQGVFNRVLLVDTAYHSHHMIPCSQGYLDSLKACDIQVKNPASDCTWISSVRSGTEISFSDDKESLQGTYWRDNMVQAVLFSQAVEGALASSLASGSYSMALEVGPHPALKGPVLQTIKDAIGDTLLYEGALDRKRDDTAAFASALGSIVSNLGPRSITLDAYANAFFGTSDSEHSDILPCAPVTGLPAYAWDYRFLWRESRINKQLRSRSEVPQQLLGVRTTDDTDHEPRWRNILQTEELPWLKDHRIQGQIVVPGAMYCAMALEAGAALARFRGDSVRTLEINDLEIGKATAIDNASEGSETIFSLHSIEAIPKNNIVSANFSISTGAVEDSIMRQVCKGLIRIHTTTDSDGECPLPTRAPSPDYLIPMSVDRFYTALGDLGLNYTGPFRAVSSLERTMNRASAIVAVDEQYRSAAVHPSWLDVSFQIVFAAFAATNDGSLWSAFVPTKISTVKLVVPQPGSAPVESSSLVVDSTISQFETAVQTSAMPKITADIEISDAQSGAPKVSIEGMTMTALTPSTAKDDRPVFQHTIWQQDILSGVNFQDYKTSDDTETEANNRLLDQLATYYLRSIAGTNDAVAKFSSQILSTADTNQELNPATLRDLKLESIDLKLIAKAAKILVDSGGPRTNQRLQHQLAQIDESFDSLLSQWHQIYQLIDGVAQQVVHTVSQIAHKHPRLRILQLGDHFHSATVTRLLSKLGHRFASLTIVGDDQSENSKAIASQDDRISVVTSDADTLTDSSFDLVLLSDPFKAVEQVQSARKLLRSGGFLLFVVPNSRSVHTNFLRAALRWNESNTSFAPLALPRIHKLLRDNGFTGIAGSSEGAGLVAATSLIVSQATNSTLSSLIQPFHASATKSGFYNGDLVIVGGSSSISTLVFVESLQSRLTSAWKGSISHVENFAEASIETLSKASLVISLTELDEPTFRNLDRDAYLKIQNFLKTCKTIQYILNTSSTLGPYHAALIGLGRTITAEDPDILLQFLDVDELEGSETIIAETALRLVAGRQIAQELSTESRLWTNELELAVRNGKLQVPRVALDEKRNNSINSVRRVVEYDVSTKDTAVAFAQSGTHFVTAPTLGPEAQSSEKSENSNLIRVSLCVKNPIITGNGGEEQYLGYGTTEKGHEVMIIVSEITSFVHVPAENLMVLRQKGHTNNPALAAPVMAGVYFGLQTEIILSRLPKFTRILLPIVDHDLANTIETYLDRELELDLDVTLVRFSSSRSSSFIERSTHAITIRDDANRFEIAKAFRNDIDVLVKFGLSHKSGSHTSAVDTLLSVVKAANTRVVAFEDIYASVTPLKMLISKLFVEATRLPKLANENVVVVKAADVFDSHVAAPGTTKTTIVDWSGDQTVRVRAQPLDSSKLFSSHKTYLLVGLTGQMGQSICKWMVQNGARYIVVTSRNPQRDGDWIVDLEAYGARIDIRGADVTSKKDVAGLVEAISHQMPQLGGVMNGAMLLADGMFADMSFENMSKVLRPKINGSQILDQVLGDAELDFFIMLSSVNAATGMTGQANYSAANMFMAGLAADRRRRGLAASVVDIGMVIGIGIIQRTEGDAGTGVIETNLRRQNLAPISEPDLHQLLAEAIVTGTRDQDVEIITGLQPYISSSPNRPAWYKNPRFSHLVFEDNKTSNGAAGGDGGKLTVANASSIEEAREILQESLGQYLATELKLSAEDISPDTPIIDLGLDSLVAAAVRSWLLTEHRADVPVLKILGGSSIHQVCETATFSIDFSAKKDVQAEEKATPAPSSAPVPEPVTEQPSSNITPASSAASDVSTPASSKGDEDEIPYKSEATSIQSLGQSRLYYSSEYLDDSCPFNCTTSYRLKGAVDISRLGDALDLVIKRNNILRTVFYTDQDTGKAMQTVVSSSPFQLRVIQGADDEADVQAEFKRIQNYAFDLATGDTFIATLLVHGSDYHTLVFGYHHIVLDGVGWQMFLQDLGRCYQDPSTSSSTPSSSSCIAFADKQKDDISKGAYKERLKYWQTTFAEAPKPLPLFPFANVSARRALSRYSMRDTMVSIDASLISAIKKVSLASKVTPFQFWLAGFQVLLQRWLETSDITIGIIDANRTDPTFAQTIGFLLEVMPVRFNVKESDSFANVLKNTRSAVYGALGNSGVPIEELAKACGVASDRVQTPFTQVVFNYRMGATKTPDMGDCAMEFLDYADAKVPFDLAISIDEKDDGSGFLTVSAQDYLYDQASVDLFIATYKHLLSQVAAMPSVGISKISMNAPALVQQGLELGTGRSIKEASNLPETISKRVNQWVSSDPDSLAVKDDHGNSLTYSQLDQRANQVANSLKVVKGFGNKSRVAFLCEPIVDISASILGISRSGAAYVPLDIYASDQRLKDIVEESSCSVILYHGPTAERVRQLFGKHKIALVNLDETTEASASNVQDNSSAEDITVILYTSGSTGKPKGVPLTNTNLCTIISSSTQHLSLGREIVLQQTGQGFDAAAWEIMTALTNGGSVIVTDNHRDPAEVADLMKREKVTTTLIMVSEFNALIQYGQDSLMHCTDWRVAITGGEQLTTNLVQKIAHLELPNLHFFNGYGPTEASIMSTIGEISINEVTSRGGDYRIPIGSVLPSYGMYIVDDNRRALPVGAVGQLAISGKGVAQSGYLGRPELTTASWHSADFVKKNTDAASKGMHKLCYLTGDRAKMLGDGSFLILGRMEGNSQVKLRGQRVELDEVASCIVESSSGVLGDVRVILRQGDTSSSSHQFLAAFAVFSQGHSVTNETEYLQSLIQSLPLANYMRPSVAVALEKLPFTERGKLDTKKLQEIDLSDFLSSTEANDSEEDLNEVELQLKSIWVEIIQGAGGVPLRISRDADFFSVGGNSLLLLRLKAEILRQFNIQVTLSELFKSSTIQYLASRIQGSSADTNVNLVWDDETEPPSNIPPTLTNSTSSRPKKLDLAKGVTILLTGSTGFLGKAILKQLITNPLVKQVHCLAVRDTSRFPMQLTSAKVTVHQGDLSKPLLGLADRATALDIFAQADAVIHNGAEVSHMKSYPSLRAANVGSTREISQLILESCDPKKGIPAIHYVSTGGVALLSGLKVLPEASLPEGSYPLTDGSHGYISSKFASERLLERLQERVPGLRIGVHRPSNITGDGVGSSDIVHNILRFSRTLNTVPELGEDFGAFDFIGLDTAAKSILDTVFVGDEDAATGTVYRHQAGEIIVEAGNLREYLGHSEENPMDIAPLKNWVDRAVGEGMDELLASFLLETTSGAKMPRLASTLVSATI